MTGLKLKTPIEAPTLDTVWDGVAEERKNLARALTNLLEGQEMPLTLSINGSWGTGKTFFLKNWQTQLSKEGRVSIYFNSWEDDHCGDPLLAMIGQLGIWLKEGDAKEMVRTVKQTFMPALVKTFFKGLSVASMEIVDLEKKDLQSTAEQAVDEYWEIRSKRDDLITRLTELAAEVKKNSGYPLIFIVDELDRCRPTFAIELLERIKHIFDVPNVVFVLGLDREQLGHSIKSVYGNIDVDGYLRRFFDMEFSLPKVGSKAFIEGLLTKHGLFSWFEKMAERTRIDVYKHQMPNFVNFFSSLCDGMNLRYRDIEQSLRSLVLIVKSLEDKNVFFMEFAAIIIIVKLKSRNLFDQFVHSSEASGGILDLISTSFIESKMDSDKYSELMEKIDLNLYISVGGRRRNSAIQELEALRADPKAQCPHLSSRTKSLLPGELELLTRRLVAITRDQEFNTAYYPPREMANKIMAQIDLHSSILLAGARS